MGRPMIPRSSPWSGLIEPTLSTKTRGDFFRMEETIGHHSYFYTAYTGQEPGDPFPGCCLDPVWGGSQTPPVATKPLAHRLTGLLEPHEKWSSSYKNTSQ